MADTTASPTHHTALASRYARLLQGLLTLAFPFLLVMACIRLVMTPLFLQLVYNRPGFPDDLYGFTTQDRLTYAPLALEYLLNGADITFLSNLRFPDGKAMYNERELRHMRDVKQVTQLAFGAAVIVGVMALSAALFLATDRRTRRYLRFGVLYGSSLTLALIVAIVIVAVVNWNVFFTGFHQLFFEGGTWRFEYSDTLIRLFPEQFWFEAALTIGGLSVIGAGLTFLLAGRWQPKGDIRPDSA
ncbi:MAG: TIGR01906 family membrane protein [Chloroflexi bacterium]|nr:TIGR01906 family membrane protein [Chloroflexota bacterium]